MVLINLIMKNGLLDVVSNDVARTDMPDKARGKRWLAERRCSSSVPLTIGVARSISHNVVARPR